jgi:hypothetical protein
MQNPRPGRTALATSAALAGEQAEPQNFKPARGTLGEAFWALEARCPDYVEAERWQQAVEDGRRFLAQWSEQAAMLGWTERDLLGLHEPPEQPHPSYSRLSRLDYTGLVWLLRGRPVVALTATTAAIENATGAITVYRKNQEPCGQRV